MVDTRILKWLNNLYSETISLDPIINDLRSSEPLSQEQKNFLADMIEGRSDFRFDLKQPVGGARKSLANDFDIYIKVQRLIDEGESKRSACGAVAEATDKSSEWVRRVYNRLHSSLLNE